MKSFQKKLLSQIFLTVVVVSIALPGVAQAGKLELKNLEKLADRAAEVNDVTLDGSLLQLAVSVMKSSGDPDAAQVVEVIKGLKGIYVKNFEFDSPGQYSQADVESIRSQLTGPGWQRIVTSYTKRSGEGPDDNLVLCVVNLDPHHTQSGWLHLPLEQLGLDPRHSFQVHDLLSDSRYLWQGHSSYVELNPHVLPAHIFRVRRRMRTEHDFDYYA